MRVLVPYDTHDPKTRLGPILDECERQSFAAAMCRHVLAAVERAGHDPTVLATGPVESADPLADATAERSVEVRVDERPLSPAVNDVLAATERPLAVVVADLPLVTSAAIDRLMAPDAPVVLAPGLGGGTNGLVVDHPDFRVDYHGGSYRAHREAAAAVGARVETVDSFRLAVDVDAPGDLGEVLLHGEGAAADWLEAAGFELSFEEGRATVERGG